MQDPHTGKRLGVGHQKGLLYYLNHLHVTLLVVSVGSSILCLFCLLPTCGIDVLVICPISILEGLI